MLFYNWFLLVNISFHISEDFSILVIVNILCVWRTPFSPMSSGGMFEEMERHSLLSVTVAFTVKTCLPDFPFTACHHLSRLFTTPTVPSYILKKQTSTFL